MDMVHDRDWNPHDFFYSSFLLRYPGRGDRGRPGDGRGDARPRAELAVRLRGSPPSSSATSSPAGSVVAAMGVLTIPVTFLIARRWGGWAAGLIAAAIVALAPLHVTNSRYVTTDVPVTLFCALTLLAAVEAQRRGGDRWWILSGVLAGLAISTKWNGAIVLVVPLVAYLSTAATFREIWPLLRRRTPYLIVIAASIALITTTPAVLLDVGGVTDFLALQAQLYARGRGNEQSPGIVFNTRALIDGIGPVAAILGLAGCVAIVAGRHRRELALPVFVVLYFIAISIPATHYERNLLPIVPYLAVAAGLLVVRSPRASEGCGPCRAGSRTPALPPGSSSSSSSRAWPRRGVGLPGGRPPPATGYADARSRLDPRQRAAQHGRGARALYAAAHVGPLPPEEPRVPVATRVGLVPGTGRALPRHQQHDLRPVLREPEGPRPRRLLHPAVRAAGGLPGRPWSGHARSDHPHPRAAADLPFPA